MSESRPDAVGVVVLRGAGDDARLLVIRRARGAFAGAWTIVMGGIEPGERATETARREVLEETGLAVTTLYTAGALDTFYDPVKDRVVVVPFFVARVADGDVRTDTAHDAHRWVAFDDARDLLTFAAQRRLLDDVRAAFVEREPEPWRTIA
jgi:dihydroneopterin triphosphate diphosphatase